MANGKQITIKKDSLICVNGHFYVTDFKNECIYCVDLKKILTRMSQGS